MEPLVGAAARCGLSVVSGGAVGIDGDVHRAAVRQGVPQLAVLPLGPDRPYPPQHAPLFAQIAAADSSGVLYAQPSGQRPTRGMFASRNALVVELSDAVIVVEAAPRSGSMITARLARRYSVPVAAVTGSTGAALLVADGAHALRWEPDDPAAWLSALEAWLEAVACGATPPPPVGAQWPAHLGWLRDALRSAGAAGLSVDGLPQPRAALPALCEAEALGLVVQRSAGRYVASGA